MLQTCSTYKWDVPVKGELSQNAGNSLLIEENNYNLQRLSSKRIEVLGNSELANWKSRGANWECEFALSSQKQNKAMEIEITRKYLKKKLQKDTTTLVGHETERNHIRDLFWRTATESESNSALLIGPKKGGKTTVRDQSIKNLEQVLIHVFS